MNHLDFRAVLGLDSSKMSLPGELVAGPLQARISSRRSRSRTHSSPDVSIAVVESMNGPFLERSLRGKGAVSYCEGAPEWSGFTSGTDHHRPD